MEIKILTKIIKNKKTFIINPILVIFGLFGFITKNSYSNSYNSALPTWISNNVVIPGKWVLTNTEPGTAKSISGENVIVLGRNAGGNISGNNNLIVGHTRVGANTTGNNNILMGQNAGENTTGNNNFAFGDRAGINVSGSNNIAGGPYGSGNNVSGSYNIGLGNQTGSNVGYTGNITELENVMGKNNIAIGRVAGNGVQGSENVSIGARVGQNIGVNNTNIDGALHNIAMGSDSGNNIIGSNNITLGKFSGNNVEGSHNFIVGHGAGNATLGNHNILLGRSSGIIGNITANETISIGTETKATKDNVTAIGYKAQALENKTIALGGNAVADVVNSVAIGDGSNTEGTSNERTTKGADKYTKSTIENKLELSFAGGNEVVGVVSVGNENETRRIQNVAPGLLSANSTDAVNGSQLYALAKKVADLDVTSGTEVNNIKLSGNTGETGAQSLNKEGGLKFNIVKADGSTYIETKASGNKIEIDLSDEAKKKLNTEVYFHVNTGDPNQPKGDSKTNKGSLDSRGGAIGENSIAVGMFAKSNNNSISFNATKGYGENNISIASESKGSNSIVLGLNFGYIESNNVIVVGVYNSAGRVNEEYLLEEELLNLTNTNNLNSDDSIIIGYNSGTSYKGGNSSVIIGYGAINTVKGGVSLGRFSDSKYAVKVNKATVGPLTYSGFAGNTPYSVVTLGNSMDYISLAPNDLIKENQYSQLQNVAAGRITKDSTDAVNGSQLYATNFILSNLIKGMKPILGGNADISPNLARLDIVNTNNIGETEKNNIDAAIKTLKVEIKTVDGSPITVKEDIEKDGHSIYTLDLNEETKEKINNIQKSGLGSNAGVASAVAMANLPQVSNIAGHRHNVAGAYGYYNGEHAFALGLSGLNETGNLVYKASGSLNTKGHVALGAGLGYQFDKLESRRKDMLTLQRNGNINLLDEKVYAQTTRLNKLKTSSLMLLEKVENLENRLKKIMQ